MQHLQPNTTLQGGKYRIERVLGQGGFGNTYVGYNTEFEETVAIKEFFMKGVTERDEITSVVSVSNADNIAQFEEQREKFKKEARRLRKLKSSHIVKVHDLFEENGTAYYVMDFIDGESLAERLKRIGVPLPETEVRKILLQILDALQEVHQQEIWHLDLKPGNIMVGKQGMAYLIDFGASKQIRANGSMTTSTALCYTPGYAPNEQIGQLYDRFGAWTDIYALGATLYNLLTNKKPPMAIDIEEDEADAFDFPTNVSDDMRKLVMWMMQPKRKARPQSVKDIKDFLDASPTSAPSNQPTEETSEETMLMTGQPVSTKGNKAENSFQPAYNDDKEGKTILVIQQKNKQNTPKSPNAAVLPQRAIQVGDFIFEDGTYSDQYRKEKSVIGMLFSKYGGAHGQIVSTAAHDEELSINDKKLEWHQASIGEWVEIINNLGHCKVNFSNGTYRYFSLSVRVHLIGHLISASQYITRTAVSGVTYIVDLERCTMRPAEGDIPQLPYLYITEF